MSGTLQGHLVIGCTVLVNETFKHRSSCGTPVNLQRYKYNKADFCPAEHTVQRLAR